MNGEPPPDINRRDTTNRYCSAKKMKIIAMLTIMMTLGIHSALAGGSISWVDVKPKIAKTDAELVKIIERDFDVDVSGGGVRLGPQFGERQGERISPFRFGALNRKTKERCELVIEESDDFWFTGRFKFVVVHADNPNQAEQSGTGQPATRAVVEPEGGEKPQPEAEGRSR